MNNNRNTNNSNRRRGRGGNRPQGSGQQLNRIDSRARGNAPQLLEKYRKQAHDAHLNGDRVQEEYYLQFADHYFRVLADQRVRQEEGRRRPDERWQEGGESQREDVEDVSEYSSPASEYRGYEQPTYSSRPREERESESRPREREVRVSEEVRAEEPVAEEEDNSPTFEPAENPFVREARGTRGLRPRRDDRRPRGDRNSESEERGESASGLDPSILPPAISVQREEVVDEAPADEAKPRRRTRRPRPPADDAGEELETVN